MQAAAAALGIVTGVVVISHGWGHRGAGSLRAANEAVGANVNQLMSDDPEGIERLAGMARLSGVPVRGEPVAEDAPAAARAIAPVTSL